MHKLFKLSAPGWEKEFETKEELRVELFKHICGICVNGEKVYDDTGDVVWESQSVDEHSSINDLLCTPCGCEFDVELENDEGTI